MTTSTRYAIAASSQLAAGELGFNIADPKGRQTGYRWTIVQLAIELLDDAAYTQRSYRTHTGNGPIPTIRVWGTPTRDGKNYGPAFNYTDVVTLEEANELVLARLCAAEKRDRKRWGALTPA